tara:strand:- start:136 stop:543 length:408 start_codon:yes stop_codon:yes gene_type:complete
MATQRSFPSIKPSGRTYSPGKYPQATFEAQNGAKSVIRYGNKRVNAQLSLSFNNITDAQASDILANYKEVNSDWDYVVFNQDSGLTGIKSTDLENYVNEVSSGLRWRYNAPPQVSSVQPGISNVSCSFVGCLDGD